MVVLLLRIVDHFHDEHPAPLVVVDCHGRVHERLGRDLLDRVAGCDCERSEGGGRLMRRHTGQLLHAQSLAPGRFQRCDRSVAEQVGHRLLDHPLRFGLADRHARLVASGQKLRGRRDVAGRVVAVAGHRHEAIGAHPLRGELKIDERLAGQVEDAGVAGLQASDHDRLATAVK